MLEIIVLHNCRWHIVMIAFFFFAYIWLKVLEKTKETLKHDLKEAKRLSRWGMRIQNNLSFYVAQTTTMTKASCTLRVNETRWKNLLSMTHMWSNVEMVEQVLFTPFSERGELTMFFFYFLIVLSSYYFPTIQNSKGAKQIAVKSPFHPVPGIWPLLAHYPLLTTSIHSLI